MCTWAGVVSLVTGAVYNSAGFSALSPVLANTTVYYLLVMSRVPSVINAGVIVVSAILAPVTDQGFVVGGISFVLVYVVAFASQDTKFFWKP